MATAALQGVPEDLDLVDRWFRALDQRRISHGRREWLVQVTGIHVDKGDVWIQIADGSYAGGSMVLIVSSTTPVERAVQTLAVATCARVSDPTHPMVINALASSVGERHPSATPTR